MASSNSPRENTNEKMKERVIREMERKNIFFIDIDCDKISIWMKMFTMTRTMNVTELR